MKRMYGFFALVILGLISGNAMAQKYYYYYQKEKQPLELNTRVAYLFFKEKPTVAQLQKLGTARVLEKAPTGDTEALPQKTAESQTGPCVVEVSLPEAKSEEEYKTHYKQWQQSGNLLVAAPCFKSGSFQKIRINNLIYVKLKSENDVELLKKEAEKAGAVILEQNRFMPEWYTLACTVPDGFRTLEVANALQESNLFEFAGPDLMPQDPKPEATPELAEPGSTKKATACVNDPDYFRQWGLENNGGIINGSPGIAGIDIKACPAWNYAKGRNIRVAIFAPYFPRNTHPDFQGRICNTGFDMNNRTTPFVMPANWDNYPAGDVLFSCIIGAAQNNSIGVSGIAPQCLLMHAGWISDHTLTALSYADAINWAWEQERADIILIKQVGSYIYPLDIITAAINRATTYGRGGKGTLFFASASFLPPNEHIIDYPATLSNVLAVGGIDPNGLKISTSAYGNALDVVAPAASIYSYIYTSKMGSAWYHGVFAGAAHAAGVAALMLEANPDLTWQRAFDIIRSTAQKKRDDIYSYNQAKPQGMWNSYMGYGLINARDAVYKASCMGIGVRPLYTTASSTVWNTEQMLDGTFTVKSGHTLTITSTVLCKDEAKILVEKGGTLILNGGKLIACLKTWQGVELQASYDNTAAGWLDMRSGARIENAKIGVLTQNDMGPLYTFKAGRITAENSSFLNCQTAININVYCPLPGTNTSLACYFNKCTFELNPSYPFTETDKMVNLTYAKEVFFNGCRFSDNRSDYTSGCDGIVSVYSKFTVKEYCNIYYMPPQPTCNGIRSEFDNFHNSIRVYDANNPANNITIDNTDFYSSSRNGYPVISLQGCSNAWITSNKFRQSRNNKLCWGQIQALSLRGCDNYKVEANDFTLDRLVTESNEPAYGEKAIEVENGHAKNEVIYRNTFANYKYGIKTVGKNKYYSSSPDPAHVNDGLQIQCNTFNYYANQHISVNDEYNPAYGVALHQGSNAEPAGNKFNGNNIHINGYNYGFAYHHTNTAPYIPYYLNCLYLYPTTNVNACPQKIITGSILIPNFAPMQAYNEGTKQWYAQTDGGNTQTLLAQTGMAISKTNGAKTSEALQKSKGFLSDQVLLAVAKNESGFTSELVRDIMVANPQCTRNPEVMKALKNRIKPLDEKMMAEILAGEKVISAREKLEMEIANHGREITHAIDENLRLLSSDSVDRSKEIIEQLNYFAIPEYKYQLAQLYFDKNDMKAYQTTLSELDKLITYDVDKEDFQHWCKLNDNVTRWTTAEKLRLDSLPKEPIQYLIDLVWTEEGRLQAKAASILALNGIYISPERKRDEFISNTKKIIHNPQASILETDIKFTLHPNPAKESLTFDYQIDPEASQAQVYIYHSSGTLAETIHIEPGGNAKTVNTGNLSNGIYYCRLIVNGETIKTIKLVVSK